jgi:hypothetical protein
MYLTLCFQAVVDQEPGWSGAPPAEPSWDSTGSAYWDKSNDGTEGGEEDMEMDHNMEDLPLGLPALSCFLNMASNVVVCF